MIIGRVIIPLLFVVLLVGMSLTKKQLSGVKFPTIVNCYLLLFFSLFRCYDSIFIIVYNNETLQPFWYELLSTIFCIVQIEKVKEDTYN